MVEYNPDRIVLMRRLEKKTQAELTEGTGISAAKISRIQNRIVPFTEEDAGKIAACVDYPLSFFSMGDVPTPPTELTYRRSSKTLVREINAVSAEYEIMAGTVRRIAERLRMKSRLQWIDDIAPRDSAPLPIARINHIAQEARRNLNLTDTGPISNVTRALERVGIAVMPMHSSGEESEYKTTSEGVSDPTLETPVSVIGYLGRDNTGDRLRFTKVHELGHMILHKYRTSLTRQQMESEAHQFAGALLMPEDDARAIFSRNTSIGTLVDAKAGWGISISALVMRISALNLIEPKRAKSPQVQMSMRGWKKHEPVAVGVESPILFKQMIGQAYGTVVSPTESRIDSFTVSNELGVPFRYLDLWADGLQEEGRQYGFREPRFKKPEFAAMAESQRQHSPR